MRIRKRPLLPLGSVSSPFSVSLSTINGRRRHPTTNLDERRHKEPISLENKNLHCDHDPAQVQVLQGEVGDGCKRSEDSLDAAKEDVSEPPCFHRPENQRWDEAERRFPLKKRSFRRGEESETQSDKEKKTETKGRTNEEEEEEEEENSKGKHDNRSSMTSEYDDEEAREDTRCSRINGRGWRCCQMASGGYSLCEHHRTRPTGRLMRATKRRRSEVTGEGNRKSRVSKARSMSSLLGLPRRNKNGTNDHYH